MSNPATLLCYTFLFGIAWFYLKEPIGKRILRDSLFTGLKWRPVSAEHAMDILGILILLTTILALKLLGVLDREVMVAALDLNISLYEYFDYLRKPLEALKRVLSASDHQTLQWIANVLLS
ncbi:hypothetical protein [Sulfitobacter sp. R18_1]|uniref:hypothetical protein n=1 Tax=Sulfitobacter sp. R18_1 TaxID=2821104 RepID=UPI001ADCB7D3|nr:hypothetical protein [Sulfitobacter sp. R18_1]MBO9428720.1 hypothetical protein [Sulfitobacter sp. R18_1]